MPARNPSRSFADPRAELRALVAASTPETVARFAATLGPDDLAILEQIVGDLGADSWRSDPATMANFLTGGEIRLWPYVRLLGRKFAEAVRGDDPRQLWNLPSQYGKTTSLVWGIVWALDYDPTLRIMYVSYDADKAHREAGDARDLAIRYGDLLRFRLRRDSQARGLWRTDQGGGLYATGVNGGITGYPADVMLGDDLLKGWKDAHSDAVRNSTWDVYRSQMRLRMQGPRDPIIIAGTRWHEDDPSGRILADDGLDVTRWTHIRLPALAEQHDPNSSDPLLRVPDLLGRAPGEPLEPDRFPIEEVAARARTLGSYLAAAVEQQRPSPPEGGEIKRAWWQLRPAPPDRFDAQIASWDMKLKDKATGDYVVGQVWGRVGRQFWCVDQLRGQWNQATVRAGIALLVVRHPGIQRSWIENTGNGPEVLEWLRESHPEYVLSDEICGELGITVDERPRVQTLLRRGLTGLLPVNPKGSKTARARAVAGMIEAGDVYLAPETAPWVGQLVDEAAAFPDGAHDDQVDAMTQALAKLGRTSGKVSSGAGRQGPRTPT